MRGSKHQKVLTLHRRLGKPIPQISVPSTSGAQTTAAEGKTVMVAAPRLVCPTTEVVGWEQCPCSVTTKVLCIVYHALVCLWCTKSESQPTGRVVAIHVPVFVKGCLR